MAKGGARANSGPPPDPDALRRDRPSDAAGWKTLSADGRSGPPPEFPLAEVTARESELWAREWRRPQAIEWEANGQEVEVALYVRALKDAEHAEASVASRQLVKQLMEALGVSLPGMQRLRWKIGPAANEPVKKNRTTRSSSRQRFGVIDGGKQT